MSTEMVGCNDFGDPSVVGLVMLFHEIIGDGFGISLKTFDCDDACAWLWILFRFVPVGWLIEIRWGVGGIGFNAAAAVSFMSM